MNRRMAQRTAFTMGAQRPGVDVLGGRVSLRAVSLSSAAGMQRPADRLEPSGSFHLAQTAPVAQNNESADRPGGNSSFRKRQGVRDLELVLLVLLLTARAFAGESVAQSRAVQSLLVTVADDNGVPVARARVTLKTATQESTIETDQAGRAQFVGLKQTAHRLLHVEKEGFYATEAQVEGDAQSVTLTLYRQREFAEQVNVYESSASLDPEQTEKSATLSEREVLALPYTATHDLRNALPLLPEAVRDGNGRIHISGAEAYQTKTRLDGFDITHPATGLWQMRVSADSIRAIEVRTSRRPVEQGHGSAGVVELTTGMGDDRLRFSATNFIPAVETNKGLHVSNWTPRWTVSGPIRRQRAWFFHAGDGEYVQNVISELPASADRAQMWRASALIKSQFNLDQRNIFNASLLINRLRANGVGLSPFNPLATTVDQRGTATLASLKEQHYGTNGLLAEAGFGASAYDDRETPLGDALYVLSPNGARGNFFRLTHDRASRAEAFARVTLPLQAFGRHEVKFGLEANARRYRRAVIRRPITIVRADGTVARTTTFSAAAPFARQLLEYGFFLQDRWGATEHLTVELGLRVDRDGVVRRFAPSPRVAAAYAPDAKTRFVLGIGVVRDEIPLALITRSQEGVRTDVIRQRDGGELVRTSAFAVGGLKGAPWFLEWSLGAERELPAAFRLAVELMHRSGHDQPTFIARALAPQRFLFALAPNRRDELTGFEFTLRRTFKNGRALLASYSHLRARSNAVLDFDLDSIVFGQQTDGPLAWETPHRVLAWGTMPLGKHFDLACSADWRTGFPYSLVDEEQRLVGRPNSARLPDYFSLNAHLEWRFELLSYRLALRVGMNNVTGRKNPSAVNNNVDSPNFGAPIGVEHRVLTSRIRFLGRK